MKRYGKDVIAYYNKALDNEAFEALVIMDDSNEYYNIHVISDRFINDEINTLKFQDPIVDMASVENVHNNEDAKKYYTSARLAGYIMEHFIWDRFYNEFGAAQISVEIEAE